MTTSTDQVEGIVEAVNERGIKVQDAWHNVSKFNPLELPGRGARVALTLDPKGFIRTITVLDAAPATASSSDRERTITRLSVLKSAANFVGLWGQARPEIKSDHVLALADRWLDWVEQEGEDER